MDASTALRKNAKALARAATSGLAGAIAAGEGRFLVRRHGPDVLQAFGLWAPLGRRRVSVRAGTTTAPAGDGAASDGGTR